MIRHKVLDLTAPDFRSLEPPAVHVRESSFVIFVGLLQL